MGRKILRLLSTCWQVTQLQAADAAVSGRCFPQIQSVFLGSVTRLPRDKKPRRRRSLAPPFDNAAGAKQTDSAESAPRGPGASLSLLFVQALV